MKKCSHKFEYVSPFVIQPYVHGYNGYYFCSKCGEKRGITSYPIKIPKQ